MNEGRGGVTRLLGKTHQACASTCSDQRATETDSKTVIYIRMKDYNPQVHCQHANTRNPRPSNCASALVNLASDISVRYNYTNLPEKFIGSKSYFFKVGCGAGND